MAILTHGKNDIYIFCESESVVDDAELTSHPTESGLPISDTVRKTALEVSITGKIVNYGSVTAKQVIARIKQLKNEGSLVTFQGTNTFANLQINRFSYSSSYKLNGGYDFNMTLVEHRIAKNSYTPPKETEPTSVTFKKGDTVYFKGGKVYVSSDATTHSATRGASTCELTKISDLKGATHIYHLISLDCSYGSNNYVYGWVDAENVKSIKQAVIDKTTDAGKQSTEESTSTKEDESKKVYHVVKKGDTLWNLVYVKYKHLNTDIGTVMKNNPDAISKAYYVGAISIVLLKVGSRLYMGTEK